MKKTILQIATFLGSVVFTHWVGILVLSIVTPFRVTQMSGSYVYSFISMFVSILIALVIVADLEDKKYFDRFEN